MIRRGVVIFLAFFCIRFSQGLQIPIDAFPLCGKIYTSEGNLAEKESSIFHRTVLPWCNLRKIVITPAARQSGRQTHLLSESEYSAHEPSGSWMTTMLNRC